ncbi:hypothetical protein ACWGVR_06095 [Streptomyces xanthophaeus]
MLTNGRITSNAVDFAKDQRLHLADRKLLAEWAADPRPLWELLRQPPTPQTVLTVLISGIARDP